MKKLIVLSCFILMGSLMPSCKSKKADAAAIPESVSNAFNARYPSVKDVKWEQEDDNGKTVFDGEFTKDGKHWEARFDETGKFIDEE